MGRFDVSVPEFASYPDMADISDIGTLPWFVLGESEMKNSFGFIALIALLAGCGSDGEAAKESATLDESLCLGASQDEVGQLIPEAFQFDCTMLRSAHFSKLAREQSERLTRQAMSDYNARSMPRAGEGTDQVRSKRDWNLKMYEKLQSLDQNAVQR